MRLALALLVLSSLAAPARAELELTGSLGPFARSGGAGGVGRIELAWRGESPWAFELGAAGGAYPGAGDVTAGLDLGARREWRLGAIVPFVSAGIVHQHEVPMGDAASEPGACLAGVCDAIRHRTGVGAALGLAFRPLDDIPLSLSARASAALLLPRPDAPGANAGLSLGLGWRW